jgi:ubiquinone/menaquinone biosynthesis C-methylase UbiE
MSMIFHHFTDPALAARECRRVLCEGGRAFLRAGVQEQISRYAYVDFFPESRPILDKVLPSRTLIRGIFETAGFRLLSTESITQTIADDYAIYAEKIASGADSVLARLTPMEFQTGLSSLRAHADRVPNQAVVEPIDFFVFH